MLINLDHMMHENNRLLIGRSMVLIHWRGSDIINGQKVFDQPPKVSLLMLIDVNRHSSMTDLCWSMLIDFDPMIKVFIRRKTQVFFSLLTPLIDKSTVYCSNASYDQDWSTAIKIDQCKLTLGGVDQLWLTLINPRLTWNVDSHG